MDNLVFENSSEPSIEIRQVDNSTNITVEAGLVYISERGPRGERGENGLNGRDGQQGLQGVGIKNIQLANNGGLRITLTNDQVFETASVKGERGERGADSTGATYNDTELRNKITALETGKADKTAIPTLPANILTKDNLNSEARTLSGLNIAPGNGAGSASIFLTHPQGKKYEFFSDGSGAFGVWDKSSNQNMFRIDNNNTTFYKNLNINNQRIFNVPDPAQPQDVTNKRWVESQIAAIPRATPVPEEEKVTKSLLTTELAKKSDKDATLAELNKKVDKSFLTAELAKKQNSGDYATRSELASKIREVGFNPNRLEMGSDIQAVEENGFGIYRSEEGGNKYINFSLGRTTRRALKGALGLLQPPDWDSFEVGYGFRMYAKKVGGVVYWQLSGVAPSGNGLMAERVPEDLLPAGDVYLPFTAVNNGNFSGGGYYVFYKDGTIRRQGTSSHNEYVGSGAYLAKNE